MAATTPDAIVVGSGPNGVAAAIRLAQSGFVVEVREAQSTLGGGMRSLPLTAPGFVHDLCAAVHPLALASPFLRRLPLADHGLRWVHPPLPLAHPFDGGHAAFIDRSLAVTSRALGADSSAWESLFAPLVRDVDLLMPALLGPLRPTRHVQALARFAAGAVLPAAALAAWRFRTPEARALFAGLAAHSFLRLEEPASAAYGLVLGLLAHAVGWPIASGGSQRLADALAGVLRSLGGRVAVGHPVTRLDDLPPARAFLLAVDPAQAAAMAGNRFPEPFQTSLARHAYGPGVFKLDYALAGPTPWQAEACRAAGTVHLGATLEEISASEATVVGGGHPEIPFVLVVQPSLFDPLRAPAGFHTLWAYCHVPNGSTIDMTDRIEAQIERFAPGFRGRIVERRATFPADLQRLNANEVGGAINGGVQDLATILRPSLSWASPFGTPDRAVYLCSASTPPGGGVHGMSGFHAAELALRRSPLANARR